jgi:hypothetical protein
MVWVYGGAFQQGELYLYSMHVCTTLACVGGASKREYIGEELARRGVVLVSFNYRVGELLVHLYMYILACSYDCTQSKSPEQRTILSTHAYRFLVSIASISVDCILSFIASGVFTP